MPYRVLTFLVCIALLLSSSAHAEDNNHLVVAWLEKDNVMVWRTGDSAPTAHRVPEAIAGNISQILLSSDGQYAAVNVINPGSLWLAAPANPDLIEAVPNQALLTTDDPKYIRIENLQRGANNSFYFNTANHPSHYTIQNKDLWSVDAASLTFKLLIPPQEAGVFSISPDQQHIAIVQAGTYGAVDGKIILTNQDGENRQEIMTFSAISSGSDNDFYPQINWQADSSAFNIAIPHKDLIYNDNTAPTTLWHVTVDGTKTQLGTVQASFFGLPQWSPSGRNLLYMRHKGGISSNQFELVDMPEVYATGEAGNLGTPQWLPASDSDLFIYQQGEPGDYWLGMPTQPAVPFHDKLFAPKFVDAARYVYATAPGDTFELRYANLSSPDSTLMATVHGAVVFDALIVPQATAES